MSLLGEPNDQDRNKPPRLAPRLLPPGPSTTMPRTATTRTSTQVRLKPVSVPKVSAQPRRSGEKKEDKGILGGLLAIPGSVIGYVAGGIKAAPTFVGKTAQTAYGFGEGLMDAGLDLIDEDIYTSRFEVDLEKARELGLEGDALVAYAAQRQYPLGQQFVESFSATGRRLAELSSQASPSRLIWKDQPYYDYGEPGIDYVRALREGNLGAVAAEDIGNVVLVGRALGLGNVVARAGQAMGGRTGQAVAGAGRFIEEPVGTTVRGIAGAAARTGRLGRLTNPLERIGQAQAPLRQATREIGDAMRARNEVKMNRLNDDITRKTSEAEAAQRAGNTERASNLQAEINDLKQQQERAMVRAGYLGQARGIIKRGKLAEERIEQTVAQQLSRLEQRGPAPESIDTYRKRASRLRKQAEKAADPATAERLTAEADAFDNVANLKEQFPEVLEGPAKPYIAEAAIHFATGKAREMADMEARGMTMEEIVAAATDPWVDPSMAERGMQPTEDGVRSAIELVKALDGQESVLNAAEIYALQAYYATLKSLSDLMTSNMAKGIGMPEGPAPFTWMQPFPIPEFLLAALDLTPGVKAQVLAQLDQMSSLFIIDLYRQGLIDEDFFSDYNIDPQQLGQPGGQPNLFENLVRRGVDEIASGDRTPVPYMIAFHSLKLSYKKLQQMAPQLMLNPDIYPAIMRPAVITRRQAVRQITGQEVLGLADQLADIARDNPDIIPSGVLDAITKDIRLALNPRTRIKQETWQRLTARINGIRQRAEDRLAELRAKKEDLNAEERTLATRLIEANQSLGALEATLRTIAARPAGMSPRLAGARQRVADAETETQALLAEQDQLRAEDSAEAQRQSETLQPLYGRLRGEEARLAETTARETAVRERLAQLEEQQAQIDRDLSLVPKALEDAEGLQFDFETTISLQGEADVRAQARGLRTERIAQAQSDVDVMKQEMDDLIGRLRLRSRGNRIDPQTGKRINEGSLAQEDVAALLWPLGDPKSPAYRAFVREYVGPDGLTLDELAESGQRAGDRGFASPDEYLTTVARTFAQLYDARQRLKEARKSADKYQGEVLERDLLSDPVTGEPLGRTGLSSQQVMRAIELQDPVALNALLDERKNVGRDIARLRKELDDISNERARVARDVGAAEGAIPALQPVTRNARLGQIETRLNQLRIIQRNALRSLRYAETAEPKEAARAQAKEERALLGGVGRIRRPAPGAEGPALGEPTAGARSYANASLQQLNRQQERNVARLKQVKRNIAEQEQLVEQAVVSEPSLSQVMRQEGDFGPALLPEGEQPLYLPAGPPRSYFPGESFELTMRGEGAAPQTRLQAARQRTSGAFVLTADGMAARIAEVLGQQYRNSVVEEILKDPNLASSVGRELGPDLLASMLEAAQRQVDEQNIPRSPEEFDRAVQQLFGTRVIEELSRRGYEVATPVRVNPETMTHAPVGDLTIQAKPSNIDENTIIMRRGLRERIVAEYERRNVREVPDLIARPLEKVGNLTSRWKSHILPLSLRWQIGDAVGIVLFAWLRGDITPKQLISRIREAAGRMTDPADARYGAIFFSDLLGMPFSDPVLAAAFGNGLQGRGLKMEEVRFIEQRAARITPSRAMVTDRRGTRTYNKFREKAFRVNEAINSLGRAAVFIENLDRTLTEKGRSLDEVTGPNSIGDPEITQAIRDAVNATNETLGAFSDLNPWEKQVMRQVFPFWSWLKFINKAAYELAIDSPDRVLFYAHLGSLASDPDEPGLADWLRGKTPLLGALWDLSFMNPYSDAIMFNSNPLTDATETFTSLSPAITTPLKVAGELSYGYSGRKFPFLMYESRPGYLEGRGESAIRTPGDVLGGAAYIGIRGLVPIARNVFDVLPTGRIPGTDIATGPVQRFGQGSLRTTGAYSEPRLSPTAGRLGAILRTFGIPAPLISQEMTIEQAREQRQRDQAARLRRIKERRSAGG